MGEAVYYLKARFVSEKEANEAKPKFQELLRAQLKAYDYWQNHCRAFPDDNFLPNYPVPECAHLSPMERYARLKEMFPLAFEYLPAYSFDANNYSMNPLASDLYGGTEEDIKENVKVHGNMLFFHSLTWHMSTWDYLESFLKRLGGRAGWMSEEDVSNDPFNSLFV